jgi:hypothetical protein
MPAQKLPLHLLVDMRCGKLSDVLTHEALAQRVHDSRCFTLRTNAIELNVEAPTQEQRDLWWKGILRKLELAGRQLTSNVPQQQQQQQQQYHQQPQMSTPQSHTRGGISSPAPRHVSALSSQSGRLSPTSRSSGSNNCSASARAAAAAAAASIAAPHTPSSNSPFSPAANRAPGGNPAQHHRSSSQHQQHPPPQPMKESTPEELRALLSAGVVLRKYDLVKTASPAGSHVGDHNSSSSTMTLRLSHIVLFAEGKGRSGSLYWLERDAGHPAAFSPVVTSSERGAPVPAAGAPNRIPLDQITDFMLRKKSPALKHAAGHSDCCFALIYGPNALSLNLEAASPQLCKMVKEGT